MYNSGINLVWVCVVGRGVCVCGGGGGGGGHNIKQMYLGKKNQIDILWSN